jgi:hypothetical protein
MGYTHWSKEEDKILLDLYQDQTYAEIGKLLGRSRGGIVARVHNLGLPSVRSIQGGVLWSKEEELIITQNYKYKTIKELSVLLPSKSLTYIGSKLSRMGLAKERKHLIPLAHKKYTVDTGYFSELNTENCYWAGFIAADGNIMERDKGVKIGIQERDRWHLEKFAYACGFSGPTAVYPSYSNEKAQNLASLSIYSVPEWLEDLKLHFNIIPRKSLVLCPPNLTELPHILSYIAGFIDGDGTVDFKKSGQLRISVLGTYDLLLFIKKIFDQVAPPPLKIVGASVHPKKNIFRYAVCGNRAIKFYKQCKPLDLPLLGRKWNKFREDYLG